jgi:hypothetical protein
MNVPAIVEALPASRKPRSPADFGWAGPVRMPDLWDQLAPGTVVSFARIIRARRMTKRADLQDEARAAELALLDRFIEQHGELRQAYYCTNIVGGCALTEHHEMRGRRRLTRRVLHTVLNAASSELIAMETTCNTLTASANSVFGNRPSALADLTIATDVVYSAMTHVLRAADDAAVANGPPTGTLTEAALDEVRQAEQFVNRAVHREGGFTYFQGVLGGAVLTLVLCSILGVASALYWSGVINTPGLVGAVVFGALGAVTSVFQRISSDGVTLAFTPSRLRLMALGALRPLVGATFGAVAYFGLVAGVLGSAAASAGPASAFGVSVVTGFAAGFSERLATDVVKRAEAIGTVTTSG